MRSKQCSNTELRDDFNLNFLLFNSLLPLFNSCLQSYCTECNKSSLAGRCRLTSPSPRKRPSKIELYELRLEITDSKYQGMPGLSYFLLTEIVLLTDCDVCRSLCSCYVNSWHVTVTDCQGRGLNTALLLNSTFPTTTQIL